MARVAAYLLFGAAATWVVSWAHAALAPARSGFTGTKLDEASVRMPFDRVDKVLSQVDPMTGRSQHGESAVGVDLYGWPFAAMALQYRRVESTPHPTFDVARGLPLPGFRKSGISFVRRALPLVPEPMFIASTILYAGVGVLGMRGIERMRVRRREERCTLCMHVLTGDGVCEQCGWVRDQLLSDVVDTRAKNAG